MAIYTKLRRIDVENMEAPPLQPETTELKPAAVPQGPSLKQKAASGVKWMAINNLLKKGLSVVTFAILARILEPSTFGLFAMAFIAIDGFSLFKAFGVDMGLIQRKDNVEEAKHTAFWLVQGTGLTVFLIFQIAAPLAAQLLKNQEVLSIMRALGFVYIFGSLGRIPGAMLQKQMRFRLISVIELIASVLNSVFAVIFALITPTVWALVGAYLIKQIATASLNWYFERYRPKLVFNKKIALELFHFGKYMVLMALLAFFGGNIDSMMVGRMLGVTALGFYVLACNITHFMHHQFLMHLGAILFPAISKIQDDLDAVRRAYFKTNRFVSLVSIPFGVVLMVLAGDIVHTIYGEKWMQTADLIRIFALVQFIVPLTSGAGSVILGCGKSKQVFALQINSLIIKSALLYFFLPRFGLRGAVFAILINDLIQAPVLYYLAQRILHQRLRDVLAQSVPAILCSAAMLAAILLTKTAVPTEWLMFFTIKGHAVLPLGLYLAVGGLSYAGSLYFFDRNSFVEIRQLLLKK